VIGGGVIGLACALRLCRQGLRTTLIEPCQSPVGASYGNAGHIAVEQVEPLASWATIRSALRRSFAFGGALDVRDVRAVASWLARFVRAAAPSRFRNGCAALRSLLALALPTWRELVVELQRPDLLLANGHVVLWESGRTAQRRRDAWMKADIGTASVRDLTAVELDAFGASLRQRPVAGIRFDGTGQVADAAELLRALRQAFETAGGDCLQARARALEVEGDAAVAILGGGARVRADVMLVAAGVASSELMATLGLRAPLIAERGYHVQWPQHEWPVGTPPVVFEDRALIVTRMRAGLRAASFVELARPHTAPDPRKWAVLDAHAAGLGLPVIGDGRRWFGARPTLPDYLPAIGRCAGISNLLYAFGHQHLGLTLAPITAQIVAELAAGREPRLPIAAFDLGRFQSGGATRATRRSKRMAGVEDPGALDSPRS
jgi:D-amino-acid dehydrogenase